MRNKVALIILFSGLVRVPLCVPQGTGEEVDPAVSDCGGCDLAAVKCVENRHLLEEEAVPEAAIRIEQWVF